MEDVRSFIYFYLITISLAIYEKTVHLYKPEDVCVTLLHFGFLCEGLGSHFTLIFTQKYPKNTQYADHSYRCCNVRITLMLHVNVYF